MKRSLDVFKSILCDTNNCKVVYDYLKNVVRPPYDYSDLLRWQWAQSVSAFDKLIHDLIRVGMVEIFVGKRNPTPSFLNFGLNMDAHFQMVQDPASASTQFEQQVVTKHSFLSFQDPKKISEALSNIWDENQKWAKIASEMSLDENYLKTKLKNISIRRNQIVHEGDYSNSLLQRQDIVDTDVADVIDFIEKLGTAIYNLVKL